MARCQRAGEGSIPFTRYFFPVSEGFPFDGQVRLKVFLKRDQLFGALSAGVVLAFISISFANIRNYGMTFDEPRAFERGRLYADCLTKVGTSFFRPTVEKLASLHHPPLFSFLTFRAQKFLKAHSTLDPAERMHVAYILWSACGLAGLFFLGKKLFGAEIGFYAVFLLALYPRFFAHAQNNPKDVPLLVWTIFALGSAVWALESRRAWACVVTGILLGLATATELNALSLVPVFVLVYLKGLSVRQGRDLGNAALLVFASAATLFAAWPVLWIDPLQLVRSILFFESHSDHADVLYFGGFYRPQNLPWHYTPFWLFAASPIPILALFFIGAYPDFKNWRRLPPVPLFLWGCLLFPIFMRLLPGTTRYDNIRHVFFVIPIFMLIAARGLSGLLNRMSFVRINLTNPVRSGVVIALGLTLWFANAKVHPFQALYVNSVVRALIDEPMTSSIEMGTWGSSLRHSIDWLNKNAVPNAQIVLYSGRLRVSKFYKLREDLNIATTYEHPLYFIFDSDSNRKPRLAGVERVHRIQRYGFSVLEIFKSNPRYAAPLLRGDEDLPHNSLEVFQKRSHLDRD